MLMREDLLIKGGENLGFYKTGVVKERGRSWKVKGLLVLSVSHFWCTKRAEGFLSIVFWKNRNQVNFSVIWETIQECWQKK